MKEYYSRLLIKDGSSIEEVKKAHRKLVKKFHPDNNSGSNDFTEEFKQIQEAYEKLVEHHGWKNNNNSTNYKQSQSTEQSGTGIVKSEAQFAEAGKAENDDSYIKAFMKALTIVFTLCCFYASYSQKNFVIRFILLAFLTTTVSMIIYNGLKKSNKI